MLCRTSWNRYASERVDVDVGATTIEAGPRGLDRLRSSSVNIDRDALRRLYLDADLTTQEIAATFGCGATTIGRRLKHFGIRVRPRGPRAGSERRGRLPIPSSSAAWSSELAYAIGLIATDGTLSRDGRHLAITSKDRDLLELIRACLRLTNSIRPSANGRGQIYHRMQWSNRVFYDWLRSIGLTPAKTFTLGPVAIPEEYFPDFFRGCIDGDGSVVVYTDRYHAHKNSRYVYKRLYVRLVSASCPFLAWIRTELRRMVGVHGSVEATFTKGRVAVPSALDVLRPERAGARSQAGHGTAVRDEPGQSMLSISAGVAKLADAAASKAAARKGIGVRLPSPAPFLTISRTSL